MMSSPKRQFPENALRVRVTNGECVARGLLSKLSRRDQDISSHILISVATSAGEAKNTVRRSPFMPHLFGDS